MPSRPLSWYSRALLSILGVLLLSSLSIATEGTATATEVASWATRTEASIRAGTLDGIEDAANDWTRRLESEGGPNNPLLVDVLKLQLVARSRSGLEGDAQTLAIAHRLVALLDELDRRDDALAIALLGVGSAHSTRGEYALAEAPLKRAVRVAREIDESSALYGTALSHLAWNYRLLDQLDRAESTALESLSVRERLGPDADASRSWNFGQLASIALARGALDRALDYNTRCLELREKIMGPQALWTGDACEMQGWILAQRGEYAEADAFFQRSLNIFEKLVGSQSQRVARVLNDLGGSATYQARNDDARRLYERALAIRRELHGENSPLVAQTLHNLGTILADLGDDEGAIARQRETLAILEQSGNGASPDAVRSRTAIARLMMERGQLDEARSIGERALADAQASAGIRGLQTLTAQLVLASIESLAGHPSRAMAFVDSAVKESAVGMGGDQPLHAQALHQRAWLERRAGLDEQAIADADSARSIRRRVLGSQHPDTLRSTLLVAQLRIDRGQPEAGLAMAIAAERASQQHALSLFDGFAERQALRYARRRPNGFAVAARAWLAAPEKCQSQSSALWNSAVNSRQLVTRTMASRARAARTLPTAEQDRLRKARGKLARLVMASLRPDQEAESTERLQRAILDKERAERALGDDLDQRGDTPTDFGSFDAHLVGGELPTSSALVGFRRVKLSENSQRYLVFLAKAGVAETRVLDLGPAGPIDDAIHAWFEELSEGELRRDRSPRSSRLACREAGAVVRRLVWDPVVDRLPGCELVFLVPDGLLHNVVWAALPVAENRYLVETKPATRVLLSERDLPTRAPRDMAIHRILSVGGVDYSGLSGRAVPNSGLPALPHSREEAESVAQIWETGQVTLLTGRDANEVRVRERAQTANLVHLGTHSFCLRDSSIQHALALNPLLRSGLVFARSEPSSVDEASTVDGMLTAEEICGLDLSRARVVILAGCSTGEGVLETGEGLLGLASALRIAGADGLILANWTVEDADSHSWMTTFHRQLRNGVPLASAARVTSQAKLDERRKDGRSTHPYHWAAFRAIGGRI